MLLLQIMKSCCSGGTVREVWQTCCLLVVSALISIHLCPASAVICIQLLVCCSFTTWILHIYIQLCPASVGICIQLLVCCSFTTWILHIYIQLCPASVVICIQLLVCCSFAAWILPCGFSAV
jgi:hypothetical protein